MTGIKNIDARCIKHLKTERTGVHFGATFFPPDRTTVARYTWLRFNRHNLQSLSLQARPYLIIDRDGFRASINYYTTAGHVLIRFG